MLLLCRFSHGTQLAGDFCRRTGYIDLLIYQVLPHGRFFTADILLECPRGPDIDINMWGCSCRIFGLEVCRSGETGTDNLPQPH